jgi:hypothetical protein
VKKIKKMPDGPDPAVSTELEATGPGCRRDLAMEAERGSPRKAWGRRGRFIKTGEDLEVLPGIFGRTGELSGHPRGHGRALTWTAQHGDTYSDGVIGLDGGLVQASCKENGGLVRCCMPLRRRRRQREGVEFVASPTGCQSRPCSSSGRAGREPVQLKLAVVSKTRV